MKLIKSIIAMVAALAATVGHAGDSAPFRLDTVTVSTGVLVDSITLPYDASWIGGDSSATVVITDNGTEVKRATGAGEFTHAPTSAGRHVLTYTTYIDDVVQEESYTATVFKGKYTIHFDSNGGEGTMSDCDVGVEMPSVLPQGTFTKEGHCLLGWALTTDGEATLLDGDSTEDIVAGEGEAVTLYAVWREDVDGGQATGANLVLNGDFEAACYTGNYVEYCGPTYLIDWISDGAGICTPKGTYLSSSIAATNDSAWAFLKYASRISQLISVPRSGSYRLDFDFCGRPSYLDSANVAVSLGEIAVTNIVGDGGSANGARVVHYSFDLPIASGGEYLLKFEQSTTSDRSPALDNISIRRIGLSSYAIRFDSNGGEGQVPKRVYVDGDDVIPPTAAFTRDGWTLVGWATEADGPVVCADGETLEGGVNAANGQTITLYARWAQNQYSIHFDANGGEGTMTDEMLWIGIPGYLSLNIFKRTGYTLDGWTTTANGVVEYGDMALVTNLTEAANATVSLYAVWSPNQYSIRFNSESGSGSMPNQQHTYDIADNLLSNTFTRAGYTFAGWATESDGVKAYGDGAEVLNLAADAGDIVDLFAIWTPNAYEVSFDALDGTSEVENMTVTFDSAYGELPRANCAGYVFLGWMLNGVAVGAETPVKTAEDHVLTAKWAIEIGGGALAVDMREDSATLRAQILPPAGDIVIPAEVMGRPVVGIGDGVFSGCSGITSVTIPDSVTSIGNGAFSGCSALASVTIPNSVTHLGVSVNLNAGDWESAEAGDSGCSSTYSSNTIGHNGRTEMSLKVDGPIDWSFKWKVSSEGNYDWLRWSLDGVEQSKISGTGGGWQEVVCSIPEGEHIVSWAYTKDGSESRGDDRGWVAFDLPSAFEGCTGLTSVTMPARFRRQFGDELNGCPITYIAEVMFEDDGNSVETIYVPCGSVVGELPTVTRTGYSMAWFTAMTAGTEVTPETIITDDMTIYARWTANEYEVTFDAAGGVVDGEDGALWTTRPATYDSVYGELPTATRVGYTFDGWILGDMVVTSNTVVKTAEDHTLVPRWVANEYEVTFDAAGGVVDGEDGGHSGRVTLPMTYDSEYGELPSASCEGYVFLGWTLDGVEVTATNIVKTADDHTLTAKWGIQVGNGVWAATVCDDPITLGVPLVPPSGEVAIPATIAGRPVVGVTAAAFAGNAAVTGVTVSAGVTRIESGAMGNIPACVIVDDDGQYISDAIAANVRKVVFANGVTRIGDNYFECGAMGASRPTGCPNLETIDIAESVVRIGTNVFEAASALETETIGGFVVCDGWVLRRDGVIAPYQGGQAGRVTLPEGVRGIAAGAFEGEYEIETVVFPSTLRFVGAGAFRDCTGLEDITLAEGVVAVDREAFRNCTYAQTLTLPTTLEEIGAGAFANATSLAGVTVPEGTIEIGECAFSNCWRMMSATIPASVTNVGEAAFADCRRLTGVTVPFGVGTMAELFPAAYASIASVRVADATERVPPMQAGMFAGCAAMTDLTLPEDLAEVSEGAFIGCASMAQFDIPDTVTNIGARAFLELAQLTAFAFPTGLVSVADEAFSGCSGISALALPEGLESIGERAFCGLPLLARVDVPAGVAEIGYAAFGGCTSVRAVSLPGDVATVAAILPDTYRQITSAAVTARPVVAPYQIIDSLFEGCEALAAVELPSSVTGIGAQAFAGCTSLTDAGIPSGVTSLGEEVFSGCANLSSVSLPKGLGVLSSRMFEGCTSLNEVVVPESVVTLGANVFDGCSSLRTVAYVGNAPAYNAAAYAGVPASLVTKVVNGSMGWDGIATSKALPEFWPAGTVNEITFWEPNRFMVAFDPNDGTTAATDVEQVTGTTYMLPADAVRRGAVFGGWWTATDGGARVTASTQVVLTRPHTFYAHWTFNRYSVHFDANGGEGAMEPQGMTVNTADSLAECGFSRAGYAFVGWATEPDGEVVYVDAAEVVDLAYAQNSAVTLYAVWEERDWTLADYVDADGLTLVNDETAAWTPDWTTFKVGGVSLRSGAIVAAEEGERTVTTLTATIVGEGSGSFWWKVSCEEMDEAYDEWYDYAAFTIDGVEIAKIAGETDWEQVEFAVTGAGTHTLAWTFTRDDYDEDETAYENVAWVDGVVWTPKPVTVTFAAGGAAEGEAPEAVVKYAGYELTLPGAGTLVNGAYQFIGWSDGAETYEAGATFVFPAADVTLTAVWELKVWTLAEAVDAAALSFTTGGNADWAVDASNGYTNGVSAKSGAVANGEASWFEATVSGAGALVFRWNVMGGIYRNNPFAYAKVEVDGVQQAQEYATDGWKEQTVEIAGAGTHTIRWTYLRTSARPADGDCAWVDAVSWVPAGGSTDTVVDMGGGKSVTVPGAWIEEHSALIEAAGGDAAAALNTPSANGRLSIADCYVLGLDPENGDATNEFRIVSFPMKADGTPDLGRFTFEPPQAKWNVPGARAVIKGAAALGDAWQEVTEQNKSSFRFFKVTVELP